MILSITRPAAPVFRRCFATAVAVLVFVAASALSAAAQTVIRGPYLQTATPTSMIVKWRTDAASDARVRYGPDPANLLWWADEAAAKTNHQVTLTALTPNTTYYYSIGTSTAMLAGGDATYFFTTPPVSGAAKPMRIWVLGNSGNASADAVAVRNAYASFTGSRYTDALLMLGNGAATSGTDAQFQTGLFNIYPTQLRQSVLWPTFGSQDAISADSSTQSGPYFDTFSLPTHAEAGGVASNSEAYYSFNLGNVHVVSLDSSESDRSVNGPMLTWLRSDLTANTQPWLIAIWHDPPYTAGTVSSDTDPRMIEMRQNVLPILEGFGVDLVLTAHNASYERSFLIDGHYDASSTFSASMKKDGGNGRVDGSGAYVKGDGVGVPHQGTVYAVVGSSAHADGGPLNHPAMFLSLNTPGSLVIDVNGPTLDATFLNSTGASVDHFTITKGVPTAPAGLTAVVTAANAVQINWIDTATTEAAFGIERAGSNGVFAEIASVAANVTSYVDTTVAASTQYSYRVRAINLQLTSAYSNAATVTTGPPAIVPKLIKAISFEDGSLTHAVSGADSISGSMTLESAAPIRGVYSAKISGSSSYLEEQFTAVPDLYLSFYLRLTAVPSSDVRLVLITNNGSTVGNIYLRSTGQLRLRANSTVIGADSMALVAGTTYRIGLHQRQAVGSTPRLLEAFVVAGDADFGPPFASTSTTSWSGNADRLRLGNTSGSVTAVIDEVHLDGAVMPGPTSGPPPAAPAALAATALSSAQVQLTWTDASTTETTFRIERAGSNLVFTQIGTVAANVTTYTDTTVAASTPYNYRVRASSGAGASTYSNVVAITTPPPDPTAPTTLVATASNSTALQLTWADKSNNETGFSLERSVGSGAYAVMATVTANTTSYTDLAAMPATTYNYRVRATNSGGSSAYSNVATATTPDVPPAAPTGLTAAAPFSNQVQLAWADGSANEATFRIERAGSNGVYAEIGTVAANTTSYLDATVAASTAYSYRVRAANPTGFSAYSAVAPVTTPAPPPPPSAPVTLTVSAPASSQVVLTWVDTSTNEAAFRVERSPGGGAFVEIGTTSADATTFTDATALPQTAYSYRVRAANVGGVSTYSNVANITTPTPPAQVLKAMTFEDGSLTHPVTGADVTSGSVTLETAAPIRGNRSAAISGSSAYLEEQFVATPDLFLSFYLRMAALPSSDTRLVLITNNGTTVATLTLKTGGQLRLKMNSTTIGSDSFALAAGLVYRIGVHQRQAVGSTTRLIEAFVSAGDAEFAAPFASSNAVSWTGNADRLRLGNSSGAVTAVLDEVRLDAAVMPGPTPNPPLAPTGLGAAATTSHAVELSWIDSSSDETAFQIERSTQGGAFIEIATVAAGVTAYSDSAVAPSTAYAYRVRAANLAGMSAYSNTATVTTPAPPPPPASPTGLSAVALSSSAVQLTWTDASTNEQTFRIERADSGGVFVEIGSVAANVSSYVDTTALPAVTYSYRVLAEGLTGLSDYSNAASVTTPMAPPAAPTGLSAMSPSSSQVRLTWADTATNETSIVVERATGAGPFTQIAALAANSTGFTDAPLPAATSYSYRVRATNGAGNSPYSLVATVTTLPPPPPGEIKAMTFEGGALVDGVTGADLMVGGVTIDSTTPVKGLFSAALNGTGYVEEDFAPASDLYLSFYLRLTSLLPITGGDVRLVQITNNGVVVGELMLRASTGKLRMRMNGATAGADSAALAAGEVYRIGLHQRAGTGATAVLEAFLATGEGAFGAPFANVINGTWTDGADRVRLGASTAIALQGEIDDVRMETLAIATASGGPPPPPPLAPTALVAAASASNAVQLVWTDSASTETQFRIERAEATGAFVEIANVAANVTTYTDATTAASTVYRYQVRAANSGGNSPYTNVATVTTPQLAPPATAPASLAATAPTPQQVQLTWLDTTATESSFVIERAIGAGAFAAIGTVAANVISYTDSPVTAATTYSYRVRGENSAGASPYSNVVVVTTPVQPAVIKAMTFEGGSLIEPLTGADGVVGAVTLDNATPIKGLFSAALNGVGYVEESFTPASDLYLSFYLRLTALLPATSGDVRLVQIANNGVVVGELMLRAQTGKLRLRFNGTTLGADSPALAAGEIYRIGFHQLAGTGANAVLEAFLASGEAAFGPAFAELTTGTWTDGADRVRLGASTAVALQGVLDDARLETVSMPGPSGGPLPPAPPSPTTLAAVTVGSAVQLTWTDTAVTETQFRIERALGSAAFTDLATVPANVTTYTDSTVASSTAYRYRVRAANAGGNSAYTNEASVTTAVGPPVAPLLLMATPASSTTVQLAWTDASTTETGFSIERAGTDGVFAEVGTAATNAVTYSDSTGTAATVYTYRVRAFNTGGSSPYSNTATVTTLPPPPPAAPTGLTATAATSTLVQLSWSDASTTETGFSIERAGSDGIFAGLAVVAANVTAYSDASVTASTPYSYRVSAVLGGLASAYSNVAVVTTPAPPAAAQVLKAITFEDGSLTHAVSGADSVSGTVTLETVSPIRGSRSAAITGSSTYLEEQFTAAADLFLSFYIRLSAWPSSDTRLVLVTNAGSTVGNITVKTNGQLRLKANGTTIGVDSPPLTAGTVYRIGMHQRAGIGSGPGVLEAFLAVGDANFAAPFASTSTTTWSGNADRLRIGSTNGAITAVLDEIRLDGATMPAATPGTPPAAPNGLSALAASSSAVQLAWTDASNNEASFRIERAGSDGVFAEIATVAANVTNFTDTALAAATPYSYRARAANPSGSSSYSNVASATTLPPPPSAPSDLTANLFNGQAHLAWIDTSTFETSVRVERADSSGVFIEIGTVAANVTAYNDATVAGGSAYSYRVRATGSGGTSSYSNVAAIVIPVPPPAGEIKAMTFEGASLTGGLTGADVMVGGLTLETATPVKGGYSAALNGAGYLEENFTAASDLYVSFYLRLTTLVPTTAGDVRLVQIANNGVVVGELMLRGITGKLRLRLNGTTIGADSAALIAGGIYRIGFHQRAGTGTNGVLEAFLADGEASFGQPFAELTTGTWTDGADRLRVGASTAVGIQAVFDDVRLERVAMAGPSGGPPPPTPPAPSALSAATTASGAVQLTWTDNASTETQFRVERADGVGSFVEIATVPANVTSFVDPDVMSVTAYKYRVRAANGGGTSAYSNEAAVMTPQMTAPSVAPATLTATVSSPGQVQLAWVDTTTNESMFVVERAGSSGTYAPIAMLSANVVTYNDVTVVAGATYTYRVRAENAAGVSPYSNVASATTPAPPAVIKAMTFEAGSLTDATTGADSVVGNLALDGATAVQGLYSASLNGTGYLEENFSAAGDLYLSFYLRLEVLLPTTGGDVRLVQITNSGVTVGELMLRASTGKLRLRLGGATVSVDSAALVAGVIYRIGIHQRAGTGANGVVEAFLASGASAFGPAFAQASTGAFVDGATRVRIGATTAVGLQGTLDDVRLDTVSMPAP